MPEKKTDRITKDMQIGEVLRKYPESAVVMMQSGLHCIGCHVAQWESIEQGSKAHGMSDQQIDDMLKSMNKAASRKQ